MGRIVGLTFDDGVPEEIRHPELEKEGKNTEVPQKDKKTGRGASSKRKE